MDEQSTSSTPLGRQANESQLRWLVARALASPHRPLRFGLC